MATASKPVAAVAPSREIAAAARPIHALLLHQAYAGTNEAGGTRHYELGSRMVQKGHRFTVIASKISYLTGAATDAEAEQGGPEVKRVFGGFGYHRNFLFR